MARREKSPKKRKSRLRAAKGAVARSAKKVVAQAVGAESSSRPTRREPDIPLDVLEHQYIPKQTSLKASFRVSGDDRQRDQDFAGGYADERWKDEDRFTNKSGDPRIGTHRRKYEPE